MAKKKKNNKPTNQISEKKFLQEKARNLPIYKCYITKNWKNSGEAHIIVARERGNGNFCVANFLVDTWCTGVKDAFGSINMTKEDLDILLDKSFQMEECDYPTVHNIIYGAVEFAGEADIDPHPDYWLWQGALDEDNDDVPFIDIEFGHDGKYYLMTRKGSKESLLIPKLQKKLGDKFAYTIGFNPYGDEFYDEDDDEENSLKNISPEVLERLSKNFEKVRKEDERVPPEEFHYDYPEYPKSPVVKHQFIADEFLSEKNSNGLPDETVDRILALPREEAISDIHNLTMYEIGNTYQAINDETLENLENGEIIHALALLTEMRHPAGLETVLEICRQNFAFTDYHICDWAEETLPYALYATARNNVPKLEKFILEEGHDSYNRAYAFKALLYIAFFEPERRAEIIETARRIMNEMAVNLPDRKGCDGIFAGIIISDLANLRFTELLPEIKKLYDTGCVNLNIPGSFESIKKDMKEKIKPYHIPEMPEIHDFYESLRSSSSNY